MSDTALAQRSIEAANEVAAFLRSMQVETEHGMLWRQCRESDRTGGSSLYHGAAGIALFLVELSAATGNALLLELARKAGTEVMHAIAGRSDLSVSPATGLPGYSFALNELAKATGIEQFAEASKAALNQLRAQACLLGSGIGWIEPMPFSDITGFTGDREIFDQSVGAAGAGCVMLYARRQFPSTDALDWAVKVADRLLDVVEVDEAGLRWRLMADMPFPFTAPNFAHGGAGVGYFMAEMYRATGNERYLRAAIGAANYVQSRAVTQRDGCLVCHTEELVPPMFYLGMCHGPVGTGRLFRTLSAITNDDSWAVFERSLFAGLLSTGAPEVRSAGLWQNYGQCCGDAGIGDYCLWMFRVTGEEVYLQLANRCAAHVLSVSSVPEVGMLAWNQAEHRARPKFLQTQTGYMQGAAGIGSFLVHHGSTLSGQPIKIGFPDMPVL